MQNHNSRTDPALLRDHLRSLGVAVLVIVAGLFASEPAAQDAGKTAAVVRGGTFIAAVPRSWPPQYSVDEDGNPTGFAIDVMEEIAKRAGIKVIYKVVKRFADVKGLMKRGEADLVPNSGVTPDRKADFLFTEPVETFVVSIFVRRDTQDVNGPRDLVGRRVGVVKNNISEKLLKQRKDINLSVHSELRVALFELLAGHDDALVFPQPVLWSLARTIGIDDRIKVVGSPLKELKRAIRVQKSQPELAAALSTAVEAFVGSPEYQRVYIKWYGRPTPFWTVARIVWTMSGLLIILLLAMAGWRYRSIVKLSGELTSTMADRERSAVALSESEARFRDYATATSDWFWETDAQGRFTFVSDRFYDIVDELPGATIGKTPAETGRVYESPKCGDDYREAVAQRRPYRNVLSWRLIADGSKHWVRSAARPIFDKDGGFCGYRGASTDVTAEIVARDAAAETA